MPDRVFARLTPPLFVLLWASGFVVARLVRPHAEPMSFLAMRFGASAILLAAIAAVKSATWPRTARGWVDSFVAGLMIQGLYLGGAYWAVRHGLAAALVSLITSLQPLLTAALAGPLLGETVGTRRWLGIAIGFVGAALVLVPTLVHGATATGPAVAAAVLATLAITCGTLWQKRIGGTVDLLVGAAIQMVAGLTVTLPLALAAEHGVDNQPAVWIGLVYSVVVLSVLTTLLLLGMIKQGAVAEVTSLFYLVPAVTALMTFALFGEALSFVQVGGMGVATLGVFLARRRAAGGRGEGGR